MSFFRYKLFPWNIFPLFFSFLAYSQPGGDIKVYIDSMMHIVHSTKGTEKLKTLDKLAGTISHHNEGLYYITLLEKEARKQSNNLMLGNAYCYKAEYNYFIALNHNRSLYYIDKAENIGYNTKSADMNELRLTIYIGLGRYTLALLHLKKIMANGTFKKNSIEEANIYYASLGHAYMFLGNYKESIASFNKSIDIMNLIVDSDKQIINSYKYEFFLMLAPPYKASKQYDLAINSVDSAFQLIKQKDTHIPTHSSIYDIYLWKADIYMDMNDLNNTRINLDNVKKNLNDLTYNIPKYLRLESKYHNKIGEYHKSLKYINNLLAFFEGKLRTSDFIAFNTLKSNTLYNLGKTEEAYKLLEEVMYKKDSINNKIMSSQIADFQTLYETEKIQTELNIKAAKLERSQAISIGLFCVVSLMLIIFIIIRRNKIEKDKKNNKIYEQYLLLKSYLNQIKAQREHLSISQDNDNYPVSFSQKIYDYLMETGAFKDENFSREELAIALGTNRQYLIEAIKEETGKTFRDFITSIRLEYAHKMLLDDWKASIENIYTNAGFSSRNTFNKHFKNQYGMTPNELRTMVKQKEEFILSKEKNIE